MKKIIKKEDIQHIRLIVKKAIREHFIEEELAKTFLDSKSRSITTLNELNQRYEEYLCKMSLEEAIQEGVLKKMHFKKFV